MKFMGGEMKMELKEFADKLPKETIEKIVKIWLERKNFGKMDNFDAYGKCTGECGETIEIYLKINNGRIKKSSFYTEGCVAAVVCGSVLTQMIKGKGLKEAEKIRSIDIIDEIGGLPEEEIHCAVVAENALKEAIRSYSK